MQTRPPRLPTERHPRRLAIAALVVLVGIAVAAAWRFTSEYTECYGSFESREAAERAASAGRAAGLEASVDQREGEFVVTFDTGETGADAAKDRATFTEILNRERGEPGHPGDGCTERGHFE